MNIIKRALLKVYNWAIYKREQLYPYFSKRFQVVGLVETLDYILCHHCSVARYGDGEFKFVFGDHTSFQHSSPALGEALRKILLEANEKLIVCIQTMFGKLDAYKENEKQYWMGYNIRNRKKYKEHLDKHCRYYNSFISRCYMPYKDKRLAPVCFEKWKEIWDKRDIVIVEGEKTRFGVGNDLLDNARSIVRILGPNRNAFDYYATIKERILQMPNNRLILLAIGPLATVLASDLSKLGYWAIDIGHLDIEYEWYLAGATEKIPVKDKFVNEAGAGKDVGDIDNDAYKKQILYKIGVS